MHFVVGGRKTIHIFTHDAYK